MTPLSDTINNPKRKRGRSLAMVMVADLIPGLKRYMGAAPLRPAAQQVVYRMNVAFLLHAGRMSCLQATSTDPRAVSGNSLDQPTIGTELRLPATRDPSRHRQTRAANLQQFPPANTESLVENPIKSATPKRCFEMVCRAPAPL
jgi:hypothetical protein